MLLSRDQITKVAGLELNALNFSEVMPVSLERCRITSAGTPIYDLNGALLFYRVPVRRGKRRIGYTDIGVNEVFAEPLLSVTTGIDWNQRAILKEAKAAALKDRRGFTFNSLRFVAYSYPKIGLQFLKNGKEVLLLEWKSWKEIPDKPVRRRKPFEASNFERWSMVDEIPATLKQKNARSYVERLDIWNTPTVQKIDPSFIKMKAFAVPGITFLPSDTRRIHYSHRQADHFPCYELRGQQTSVWCVAASVEMLLNFYRYQYFQPLLANKLDLGTCSVPYGLPYGDEDKVVEVIETLSSNNLDATKIANPSWSVFKNEIKAHRPLISFIPGHSRTVAGYTQSLLTLPGKLPFRGLLVYDPWPPTTCALPEEGGVITTWENFATQTYRFAFTAKIKHV